MEKIRKFENFHIVLWLLKDASWLMTWRSLGIFMIIPTLGFAIYITLKQRHIFAELTHNMALVFWITANSYWMITEFFGVEEELKLYAAIPFSCGFTCLGIYYLPQIFKLKFRKVSE
jgi:hypothetical protein